MSTIDKDQMDEQIPPIMDGGDIRRMLTAVFIIAAFALLEVGVFWFTSQDFSLTAGTPGKRVEIAEPLYNPPSVELLPAAYTGEKRERQDLLSWGLADKALVSSVAPTVSEDAVEKPDCLEPAPTRGALDSIGRGETRCR